MYARELEENQPQEFVRSNSQCTENSIVRINLNITQYFNYVIITTIFTNPNIKIASERDH